jgi:hypothetical protein
MTDTLPNLAGIATSDLVESIGAGKFSAAYINWSRTMHLLRTHAPGWLPELVQAADGGILHAAPAGAFLLIRFRHMGTGAVTPAVPQAVMDPRNAAIPLDKITARDITDTHRRGACMAAALTFGLAYELWAKMPLESGYAPEHHEPEPEPAAPPNPDKLTAAMVKLLDERLAAKGLDRDTLKAGFGTPTAATINAALKWIAEYPAC